MKKLIFIIAVSFIFATFAANAEITDSQKKFIKGNIQDKTAAVKEAENEDAIVLPKKSIDFVLSNAKNFAFDRDFNALALASVLKLPKDSQSLEKNFNGITDDLIQLFTLINDETVRIAIIDKFNSIQSSDEKTKSVALLNNYIKNLNVQTKDSAVTKNAIECLGKNGNSESFILLYGLWKNKICENFENEVEKSLLMLTDSHINDCIKLIARSSVKEIGDFFNLIKNSSEIHLNFKAEIAENTLLATINNTEGDSKNSAQTIALQLNALQILSDAQWTRSASLSVQYFLIAKDLYKKNILKEDQFIQVIKCMTNLSSPDAAQNLSNYLAEINSLSEKSIVSAQNVVLAVINSLGALGDKTAFDNLLYVTYLNYPEEIKNAARNSLAKLKW